MNKKRLCAILCIMLSLSLVGCSSEEASFEDKVILKFDYTDADINELRALTEDLYAEVNTLKSAMNLNTSPTLTSEDINFSSIRLVAKENQGQEYEDTAAVKIDSTFNLSIDVMNSSEESLSKLTCQAYIIYKNGDTFYDRYMLDTQFDVLPKSVRRNILLSDFPVKDSSLTHTLVVNIKDTNGNIITEFEKDLVVA